MGTVPYMSPEQVRGLPADARSDVFALGSVLYEMLARRRAFVGETASEVETAILRAEPPELPTLDSRIPAALDRIVRRCLEKRAEDRFETSRDVAFALEAVATNEAPKPTQDRARSRRGSVALALSGIVAGLLVGGAVVAWFRQAPPPPSFTQLTFRHGTLLSARFSHDGQTVVYSAAWDGQPAQVYTTRIGSPEARPLGIEGIVLSVSPKDEVAVKLGRFWVRHGHGKDEVGTLARVPLAGGAPREVLENVTAADWDEEGRDLAVVHDNHRLEYPIGHVVYESEEVIFFVRALPGGSFAFMEFLPELENTPSPFAVSLVDRGGKRTVLSRGWGEWRDLGWSQASQELFFAGSRGDETGIRSVSLAGRERLVARIPGDFTLHDVDPRGRILLDQRIRRYSVVGLAPGEHRERDLSWLGGNGAVDLSSDGRQVVMMEYAVDPQALYLRKTDGSPAVKLGDENGIALSPDGRWVLAFPGNSVGSADHIVLVPTGAGVRRELRDGSIRTFHGAAWFPDGRRLAVLAGDSHRARLFTWDVDMSASPRPVSPDGDLGALAVSPDGRSVAVALAGTGLMLYPVDGGPARPVAGAADERRAPALERRRTLALRTPDRRRASWRHLGLDRSHRDAHRESRGVEGAGAHRSDGCFRDRASPHHARRKELRVLHGFLDRQPIPGRGPQVGRRQWPQRLNTCAVMATLAGGFSPRPREWSISWMRTASCSAGRKRAKGRRQM